MVDALAATLAGLGRFGRFGTAVGAGLLRPPWYPAEALRHTAVVAMRCLLPVLAVTLPIGMVIALQGLEIFAVFGAERLLSSLVSVTVLRELAPVMASVLVAAQGGASVAAELGAMRIREELDATAVMAVDPLRFHAVPRVVGLAVACPLLYVAGAAAGVLGGYASAVGLKGEPGGIYWENLWALCTPMDLWGGLLKTAVFGVVIGLVAAFHGYEASGGAAGVGRAVNLTVVRSVLGFIAANYLLTSALFGAGA